MTKRKKSPTSGEGDCPPKAPKTPRLGDSDGGSRSPTPPGLHHLEEAECRPTPATTQSQEQPGPARASFQAGDTAATSRGHQGPVEKEDPPASSPLSQAVALRDQKGAGRFVPQFAKSRKPGTAAAMAPRRPEGELEAPGDSWTLSLEKLSEPSTQQAGSQQLAGSGQEPQGLGEEMQPDCTSPEQSDQDPVPSSEDAQPAVSLREEPWPLISPGPGQDPVPSSEDAQPTVSPGPCQDPVPSSEDAQPVVSLQEEPWPLISPGPGLDPMPSSEDAQPMVSLQEEPWTLTSQRPGQDPVPSSKDAQPAVSPAPGQDPVPSSEDVQPTVSLQEEPWPLTCQGPGQDPVPSSEDAQPMVSPVPGQAPVPSTPGSGEGLESSRSDPEGAQLLGDSHNQPGSPPSSEAEGGAALEGGTQGRTAGAALPQRPLEEEDGVPSTLTSASVSGPTSPQETPSGAGGEAEGGLGSPGCSSQVAAVIVDAPSVRPPAPEQRALWVAGAATKPPTSPSSEALLRDMLGGAGKAGQEDNRDEILVGPRNGDPLIDPAPGLKLLPHAAAAAAVQAAAVWEASSAEELDFLPDSLIQDALDGPDLEAPPEQGCPALNRPSPCWPNLNSCAPRDAVAVAKPPQRPCTPPEACPLQDASDTVRGLVLELSNLNRLIMSAHRDLDAFRRLQHRKPKATAAGEAGPGLAPYARQRAGAPPQQLWKDL
ncbi:break repair meiotic recombinase recruitment factor 1 [Ochotona princeps]|uniref:break repair meiotic recombinase recruitment factor 1 n=1 Tax=Ochotona princeps TaxID=9978 RepID=UPI0027152C85|nr:break repair meiotic recombinase recruitment factor 1 [Ochotona princeps]